MTPPGRTMLGALVLCALSICALGAASASAAGLTAVECVEVEPGKGKYNTSQCLTPAVPGDFETKVLPLNEKKAVEGEDTRTKTAEEGGGHGLGSTEKPVTVLHLTGGGMNTTVTCGTGHTTGASIENKTVGEEMQIHVTGAVTTWTECHASPEKDPTKQCKVEGTEPKEPEGAIATNKLTAITGANHQVTIKPEAGEIFAKFKILKKPSTPNCFATTDIEITMRGEATGTADTNTHSHLTIKEPWPIETLKLKANGGASALTETVTGFTKDTATRVGAETF